jgi:hypothetical protein
MKINFETIEDGSVRLIIEGSPDEVGKIQQFVMSNMAQFMAGINATKEEVKE